MATVVERTAPVLGKRAVLIGMAGLLLGGIAGGLLGAGLQSDEPNLGVQSGNQTSTESASTTGTITSAAPSTDIEALRAQRFAPAPVTDIEAVRAQRYATTAPAKVEFLDIEALRAQRYETRAPAPVVDIEAVRAQRYAPTTVERPDIEALRAKRYAPAS